MKRKIFEVMINELKISDDGKRILSEYWEGTAFLKTFYFAGSHVIKDISIKNKLSGINDINQALEEILRGVLSETENQWYGNKKWCLGTDLEKKDIEILYKTLGFKSLEGAKTVLNKFDTMRQTGIAMSVIDNDTKFYSNKDKEEFVLNLFN